MKKIKKGDIVGRGSYNKDILFIVTKVIEISNGKKFAILKGLTIRIQADAPVEDLEIIEQTQIENSMRKMEDKLQKILVSNKTTENFFKKNLQDNETRGKVIYTGKILHLDGDRRYSEKSMKHYRELGLNAIVKNIAESKQKYYIKQLLDKYEPDILVITGHDGMIKNNTGYNDIYNYRNSNNFIKTVKEARKWEDKKGRLVIFAGACQSFFEAIMEARCRFCIITC